MGGIDSCRLSLKEFFFLEPQENHVSLANLQHMGNATSLFLLFLRQVVERCYPISQLLLLALPPSSENTCAAGAGKKNASTQKKVMAASLWVNFVGI